jgi:hypothetical protein
MQPWTRQIRRALLGVALSWGAQGCLGQACDTHGQDVQLYTGGRTNPDRSAYESSSSEGPFLFFPAGRHYRFEHNLSEAPFDYGVVLSWAEAPFESGNGIAESAGNHAIVERFDERFIEVRADTCADLYMRLWARVAPFKTTSNDDAGRPSAADAGP